MVEGEGVEDHTPGGLPSPAGSRKRRPSSSPDDSGEGTSLEGINVIGGHTTTSTTTTTIGEVRGSSSSRVLKDVPSRPKKKSKLPGKRIPPSGLYHQLWNRSYHGKRISKLGTPQAYEQQERILGQRFPSVLSETIAPKALTTKIDKVFASQWLSPTQFVVGTKCNQLLVCDTDNLSTPISIPLNPGRSYIHQPDNNSGIHCIAMNKSKTLLASGGWHPDATAVFALPCFTPVDILEAHRDWVFAAEFLSDTLLATGGRDGKVMVWDLSSSLMRRRHDVDYDYRVPGTSDDAHAYTHTQSQPVIVRDVSLKAVRDMTYREQEGKLITVNTDHTVGIYDVETWNGSTKPLLRDYHETVCVESHDTRPLIAFGSKGELNFVDLRQARIAHQTPNPSGSSGIRSIVFRGDTVGIGEGAGHISFIDLRFPVIPHGPGMGMYSHDCQVRRSCLNPKKSYYGGSSLVAGVEFRDARFPSLFLPSSTYGRHAIFTLKFDPTGTQLLAAGGPLQFGLRGSYLSIW